MAFLIKDSDKSFIGSFGEVSENQFTFLATDFENFYVENLSVETILDRTEEMNESIRYKQSKVLKTIQEETPISCAISSSSNALRVDLKFDVNRPLNIYFELTKCGIKDVGPLFTIGLVKLAIENSIMMEKLHKAVEAKDLEIEEYKRNGATLVRESLATKKFDYAEEFQSSKVKLVGDHFSFNPSPLLKESNIPHLCSMIRAENVLDIKKKVNKAQSIKAQQNPLLLRARVASRIPVAPKPIEKKPLEYVNDDEGDDEEAVITQSAEQLAKEVKKPRIIKKSKFNL